MYTSSVEVKVHAFDDSWQLAPGICNNVDPCHVFMSKQWISRNILDSYWCGHSSLVNRIIGFLNRDFNGDAQGTDTEEKSPVPASSSIKIFKQCPIIYIYTWHAYYLQKYFIMKILYCGCVEDEANMEVVASFVCSV